MAIILRGNDQGKQIKLAQYCNDWCTSTEGKVYTITNLHFTIEEALEIAMCENSGFMFSRFRLINYKCGYKFIRREN